MAEEDLYSYFKNEGRPHLSAYCIVQFEDEDGVGERFKNDGDGGLHAEEKMIEWLKTKKAGNTTLNIFQNKAPCKDCAPKLVKFAQKNGLTLNIKAVGPHYDNKEELRRLMQTNNIHLNAFTEQDWKQLRKFQKTRETRSTEENNREFLRRDGKTAREFADI